MTGNGKDIDRNGFIWIIFNFVSWVSNVHPDYLKTFLIGLDVYNVHLDYLKNFLMGLDVYNVHLEISQQLSHRSGRL